MLRLDLELLPKPLNQSKRFWQSIITTVSILLGSLCLGGFIVIAIHYNLNSKLVEQCRGDVQSIPLCFIRSVITNAFRTHWDQYILVSLLLTYASVLFHIIIETNRTNVSGLLGQMLIQTMCIVFGIGVAYPILFIPSYIYFYKSRNNSDKSPVPIDILYIGLIYVICIIILPTYLIYFFALKHAVIASILSIILLASPFGFGLISLPFRLLSDSIQRCWTINSHRLIVRCQVILFILTAPLFFITLVSLILHLSVDIIKQSYVSQIGIVNPVTIIWSIDYTSLLIGLILIISTNEYLSTNNSYRSLSSKIKIFIGSFIFLIIFLIAPCLVFPLYIAWKEYRYIKLI